MFFSKMDKYIVRKFLLTFLGVFALIIAIAIVIDISEKLDDFMECEATTGQIITEYYLSFIPYMGALLAPFLIFITVIFFTSRMAYNSEIIAILSSGVSFMRFLRPFFISGILLSGIMLYSNHFLVPRANKVRIAFEMEHIRGQRHYGDNIYVRLDEQTFISLTRFKYKKNEGVNFILEHYNKEGNIKELAYKLTARKIFWRPDEKVWRITDYSKWMISGIEEAYSEGRQFDTILNMVPEDFEVNVYLKEAMDRGEMRDFLQEEAQQGSNNLVFFEVEDKRRTASALSIFILTIIGASIASRKSRGGTGLHLAMGVGLSATYIVFLQFSSTFSTNGGLDATLGSNIPNLVFGLIALVLIRFTPK